MATKTAFTSTKEAFEAGLRSLFSGLPEATETDLAALFAPTFTQRDDDTTRDFAAFVAHIRFVRDILRKSPAGGVTLDVVQFVRDGPGLAERHLSATTMPDGTVSRAETFLFAEVADDGRLAWIVETVKIKETIPGKA